MKFPNIKDKVFHAVILIAMVLVLTGTYAWFTIQTAFIGGKGVNYHYVVNLMDEDFEGIYQYHNWKIGESLIKPVYATSSYQNKSVEKSYHEILDQMTGDTPYFSNTWVRIKITETLVQNGITKTEIVKAINDGKVLSSFAGYFEFSQDETSTTSIYTLNEWYDILTTQQLFEVNGRFWILDEDTGWLYWGQPVLAPTINGDPLLDQETDHILDKVELSKQPSGIWDYKITACLEAFDAELVGYEEEGAWRDIENTHKIHHLFARKNDGGDVYINITNFPDTGFHAYLLNSVTTTSGDNYEKERALDKKLTDDEINDTTIINLGSIQREIKDLTGIEHFTELLELLVYTNENQNTSPDRNNLIELDLGKNIKLTHLTIYNQPLTAIDISKNINLIKIRIYDNQLTTLDVSKNVNLVDLHAYNNLLTTLLTGENKKLIELSVHKNNLATIDVSKNVNLEKLYLYLNPLTTLDISKNVNLTYLGARDTNMTSLDISKNVKLENVYVYRCNLTTLHIGENENLAILSAYDNQLTELDVSKNVNLAKLTIYNNQLTTLDVSHNVKLSTLNVYNNELTTLFLGEHQSLMEYFHIQSNRLSSLDISTLPAQFQRVDDPIHESYRINFQYKLTGPKTYANQRQYSSYNSVTKMLTWV